MNDFKVAFVVEGTNGGCREICTTLAKKGFAVAFTYSGDASDAADLVREVESHGVCAKARAVKNFTAPELSAAIVESAEELGSLDLLVYWGDTPKDYEAGGKLILDLDEQDWDMVMDRGVKGFFLSCKYILPYLISRSGSRVVAIDTKPHDSGECSLVEFVASRALHSAVEHIAIEMSYYGIAVICRKMTEAGWMEEFA